MRMNEDRYQPVSAARYLLMQDALRNTPQDEGRFAGKPAQRKALAQEMRDLFDRTQVFGLDPVRLDRVEVDRLADDLEKAQPRWSIGQYAAALSSLREGFGE